MVAKFGTNAILRGQISNQKGKLSCDVNITGLFTGVHCAPGNVYSDVQEVQDLFLPGVNQHEQSANRHQLLRQHCHLCHEGLQVPTGTLRRNKMLSPHFKTPNTLQTVEANVNLKSVSGNTKFKCQKKISAGAIN